MTLIIIETNGESSDANSQLERNYSRNFVAYSTTRSLLRPIDIYAHPSFPRRFERHPADPQALALNISMSQSDVAHWIYTGNVDYSTTLPEQEDEEENPLKRPARIGFKRVKFQRPVIQNYKGNPLTNFAGDFVEGITRDESRLVITVEKNLRPGVPRWIDAFADRVNRASVTIRGRRFKKRTLKFEGPTSPPAETAGKENGYRFIKLSFELHHRSETWDEFYLSQGFNEKHAEEILGGDGEVLTTVHTLRAILLGDGEKPTKPQWIDKAGQHLPQPTPAQLRDLIIRERIYLEANFRSLPLD
jgi:hypothetical protein